MKYKCLVIVCVLLAAHASAQQRNFGMGLIVGEPTGISAKLWTAPDRAFDFGLGWSFGGDRLGSYNGSYDGGSRVHLHADYLWHSFDVIHSTERFPLYYGVGAHLNSGAGYNSAFAVRGVLGLEFLPHATPMDVFVELVPALQLTTPTGLGLDAGIGARYFFR